MIRVTQYKITTILKELLFKKFLHILAFLANIFFLKIYKLTLATAKSAVALALIMTYFRVHGNILIDLHSTLISKNKCNLFYS